MRISFVSHEYPPLGGGASTALEQTASRLAAAGHDVQVVTVGTGWKTVCERTDSGMEIVRMGVGRTRILAPGTKELLASCFGLRFMAFRHLRRFRPECMCAFFAFPAGYAMIRAAKRLNVPLLVSLRGSDVPGFSGERLGIFGKVLPWFFRTATRAAALVVPNGRRLAELAAPHAGQAAVHVLPNGVDTDVFHPSASPRQDSVVRILFVGQFIARKRCRELLEALAALPDHGPAMEVGLAGGGPLEPELQSLAARAPERVRVRFLGLTDRDHMPDVYRNHDLLVQISRSEGVSNVVLEGLASGLAVLAAPEAVDGCLDGAGGIERLERFDPRTLGSVLDRLAGDRARLAALQSEARASSSQLGWGARIAEFERIASRAVSDFSRS